MQTYTMSIQGYKLSEAFKFCYEMVIYDVEAVVP